MGKRGREEEPSRASHGNDHLSVFLFFGRFQAISAQMPAAFSSFGRSHCDGRHRQYTVIWGCRGRASAAQGSSRPAGRPCQAHQGRDWVFLSCCVAMGCVWVCRLDLVVLGMRVTVEAAAFIERSADLLTIGGGLQGWRQVSEDARAPGCSCAIAHLFPHGINSPDASTTGGAKCTHGKRRTQNFSNTAQRTCSR